MTKRTGSLYLALKLALVMALGFGSSGCVMQETVRDEHGNVIYERPVKASPFESDEEKTARVLENEQALGW